MKIKKLLISKIDKFNVKSFINDRINNIDRFFNQIKDCSPLPMIIILYFILGLGLANYHIDIPQWIDAGAASFSAWIAYRGLKFAESIFSRNYEITGTLGCTDDNKIMIIVSVVNKSRISTCIDFLGIVINKNDLIYNTNEIAVIHAFPNVTSSNSDNGYKKYVGIFTNVSAYNSFNFKIPYNDILEFMKNHWSKEIYRTVRINKPVVLFLVFEDYRRKIYIQTITIKRDTIFYNKIKDIFISNNEIEA